MTRLVGTCDLMGREGMWAVEKRRWFSNADIHGFLDASEVTAGRRGDSVGE